MGCGNSKPARENEENNEERVHVKLSLHHSILVIALTVIYVCKSAPPVLISEMAYNTNASTAAPVLMRVTVLWIKWVILKA